MRTKRLNPIQVAASAAGAVLSAVIASFFGVEGTIIGTAIGSIVATTVSALVWESIERGHDAVRQVVVKEHGPLFHQGTTTSAGEVTSADAAASAVEAQVDAGLDAGVSAGPAEDAGAASSGGSVQGVDTGEAPSETAASGHAEVRQQSPIDPTRQERMGTAELPLVGSVVADGATGTTAAATASVAGGSVRGHDVVGDRRLLASSRSGRSKHVRRNAASPGGRGRRRFQRRWVVAASVVGVFVLALGIVTVVEAIAGRPLSSLVGGSNTTGGTSFGNVFSGGTHGPPASTTTTTSTSTTTTTAPSSTTTTTTTPLTSSTTTTTPSTPTTTTTTTTTPSGSGTGRSATATG